MMSTDVALSTSPLAETALARKAASFVDCILRALTVYLRETTMAFSMPGKGLKHSLFAPTLAEPPSTKTVSSHEDPSMVDFAAVLKRYFKRLEEGLQRFVSLQEIAARPQDLTSSETVDVRA
jgi:hypothetical protein